MAVKATNQLDIVDLTDGYAVILSADSVTVPGDKNGAAIATTNAFSIAVTAMCGGSKVACSVVATCPTGISAGTASTSNNVVTIPFSVANTLVSSASITLAVTITAPGVTINKTVAVTVAKTGGDGQNAYTYVRYSANSDGSSMTDTPTSSTKYIGVYTGTASTCPAYNDSGFKWSKYQGDDGDDALMMVITSSAGTIFKNTQAATTLTAHIFQGATELNSTAIAALGTVKWYKDGTYMTGKDGLTLSISAGDVTDKATYTAKLEA